MSDIQTKVPEVTLNDGVQIPQLGFGVFQLPPEATTETVLHAFETGYRHIDTAAAYGNEAQVGEAVRASGLDRDDVFVTTKCFNDNHGYDAATAALRASLDRLELDFVDLYLIHWPVPAHDLYVETWQAFIDQREAGLIRSIGVSNFQPEHLERIAEETGVTPSVNQIELHPRLQQPDLRRVHAERGIATEAWSPLAQGEVLDDPTLAEIADAHGRTPGQVTLRWHLQIGNIVFPKSATRERIVENFELFDFELSGEELQRIEGLDVGERIGPHPDTFVAP
jgi:diketogulonate reductase-like aldo/keto reductase